MSPTALSPATRQCGVFPGVTSFSLTVDDRCTPLFTVELLHPCYMEDRYQPHVDRRITGGAAKVAIEIATARRRANYDFLVTDRDIINFYQNQYDESTRLTHGPGDIELLRTLDVLTRFLPSETSAVLDVGGGAGVYADWLANQGHDVSLIDPVPRHVETANKIAPGPGSITASIGDARSIEAQDDSFDVVLMLGPLYHLPEPSDRIAAWAEAKRVCRPGGLIAAAVISRFASFHDMLTRHKLTEPGILEMVTTDLETGQHRNPAMVDGLFTTAYLHHPDEISREATAAGVEIKHIIGVEGLASYAEDLPNQLADETTRTAILDMLRKTEEEASIVGASNHILAIAAA